MFGMKRFVDYIASLRRSRDLTQGELAGKLGVSHQAVSKRERGETIPGISRIGDLAYILGIAVTVINSQERKFKSAVQNNRQNYARSDRAQRNSLCAFAFTAGFCNWREKHGFAASAGILIGYTGNAAIQRKCGEL